MGRALLRNLPVTANPLDGQRRVPKSTTVI